MHARRLFRCGIRRAWHHLFASNILGEALSLTVLHPISTFDTHWPPNTARVSDWEIDADGARLDVVVRRSISSSSDPDLPKTSREKAGLPFYDGQKNTGVGRTSAAPAWLCPHAVAGTPVAAVKIIFWPEFSGVELAANFN